MNTKQCTKCREEKALESFSRRAKSPDGLDSVCRACKSEAARIWRENNKEKNLARIYAWKKKNPERTKESVRWSRIKSKYGLTKEGYFDLLEQQGGGCAVCGEQETWANGEYLCVDHDHSCCPSSTTCGKCIRGLVCNSCNLVLGIARDDTDRLRKSIAYLAKELSWQGTSESTSIIVA